MIQGYTIRPFKHGDLGQVLYLHGLVYSSEHGFDLSFEGYVAAGIAEFACSFKEGKDQLWVAEADGQVAASIAVFGRSESEAQLRWFIVHPAYRGLGMGKALLKEALEFAKRCAYTTVFLWTLGHLDAARHLYKSAGFVLAEKKTHVLWGKLLTEERYDLSPNP
ncbi:MAG: GNAT family N-acetyltransferase [Bacillota bacterium]